MQLNPYLTFNGQCEAAFEFSEKVLGGKIEAMTRHAGSPMEQQVPAEWGATRSRTPASSSAARP